MFEPVMTELVKVTPTVDVRKAIRCACVCMYVCVWCMHTYACRNLYHFLFMVATKKTSSLK